MIYHATENLEYLVDSCQNWADVTVKNCSWEARTRDEKARTSEGTKRTHMCDSEQWRSPSKAVWGKAEGGVGTSTYDSTTSSAAAT